MTHYAAHLDQLNAQPVHRRGAHGRAALEGISNLHGWLPLGSITEQMQALVHAAELGDQAGRGAVEAWAGLVRGHALDFHADAGQDGSHWQHAVVDAWETWLMLRHAQHAHADRWPWEWHTPQFAARGIDEPEEPDDVDGMMFGAGSAWKRTDLLDWRRGLARPEAAQACQDALTLARAWPRSDLPSLALATGALWAIGAPGWVVGAQQLEIGGVRGQERLIFTHWAT